MVCAGTAFIIVRMLLEMVFVGKLQQWPLISGVGTLWYSSCAILRYALTLASPNSHEHDNISDEFKVV
jgi:hypothetical protein